MKALVAAAKASEGQFEHVLQRARDTRAEATQITTVKQQIAESGTRLIDPPEHGDGTVKNLTELVTNAGKSNEAAQHITCPGHAAYVTSGWRGVESVHVCTDWIAQGHRDRYSRRPAKGQMTEQEKSERRTTVTNNKAWKSAQAVRRAWLSKFLTRKAMPKAGLGYLAVELAHGGHALRRAFERSQPLAPTLLGIDPSPSTRLAVIDVAEHAGSDGRAAVVALGVVLAAIEDATGPHTWANPSDTNQRYLAFLAANGYVLSEVEQLAAGTNDKDNKKAKPSRRARQRPTAVSSTPAEDAQTAEPVPGDTDTEDIGDAAATGDVAEDAAETSAAA